MGAKLVKEGTSKGTDEGQMQSRGHAYVVLIREVARPTRRNKPSIATYCCFEGTIVSSLFNLDLSAA